MQGKGAMLMKNNYEQLFPVERDLLTLKLRTKIQA